MVLRKYGEYPVNGKRKRWKICRIACVYAGVLLDFHRPERDKATSVAQNEDKRYGFGT
ncbi:hypothetical protein [Bacteroides helcogenes]|uniref:hypothetical protein n=1 Tax=Bacteroides helcogenes TaxID=290053 RepID=UPI002A91AB25|nr:hypothetical protein [Bacteroides helcogenes]MDY5237952.1 hypothetical protein [Bacteroides helcogenes]